MPYRSLFIATTLFISTAIISNCWSDTQAIPDTTGLLSAEQSAFIEQYHHKLLESYDIDYQFHVTNDDEEINQLAHHYFTQNRIGQSSKTNRGLLLVINPRQNLVRLEVSKGLESVYTDAFISYIEHRQMIPFFKAGQVNNGILATAELIFARAANATAGKQFDPLSPLGSEGAGAANNANIGSGMETKSSQSLTTKAEDSPTDVVSLYLKAMADRNNNPELSIYSESTKEMQRKWVVTAAQMDMLSSTYQSCKPEWVPTQGTRAVVIYSLDNRACAPYFLIRENGGWKLDLTMMQKAIRFNHLNQWHFDVRIRHPYEFAFAQWTLDENGFPSSNRKPRWDFGYTTNTAQDGQKVTLITRVGKDSFAEHQRFQVGDMIVKWNEIVLPDYLTINRLIDSANEGDPFNIIIQRGQNQYTIAGKSPPRN